MSIRLLAILALALLLLRCAAPVRVTPAAGPTPAVPTLSIPSPSPVHGPVLHAPDIAAVWGPMPPVGFTAAMEVEASEPQAHEFVTIALTTRILYCPRTGDWRTSTTGVNPEEDFRVLVPSGVFPLPRFDRPDSRWPETGTFATPQQFEDLLTMARLVTGIQALWVDGYDGLDPVARPWALAFPELMQPWLARWRR